MSLEKAADYLAHIRGKKLSEEERREGSIELAAYLLTAAHAIETPRERKQQAQLARMMRDPRGKAFTTSMTDQCFRSHRSPRVANQLIYLLGQLGIPSYLSMWKRFELAAFQTLGAGFSYVLVPLATRALRKETSSVILPGERAGLSKHMARRRKEGVRLNLNHLGEAILGEEEAKKRLSVYLQDLAADDVEYVSIKISTIFSQINLLSWDKTLSILAERLRQLYRAALMHTFTRADGTQVPKFVNLDMEEYRDLWLTKELFKKVLSEPEFLSCSAGIVLQAYLPDSHEIQKELTQWALARLKKGGAPIKIRIVKGANLAMEQVEASLRGWAQAPYTHKAEVDANYKKMVTYGCISEHAHAVYLGIASHNLFDIAYAMILRTENELDAQVCFEMLEGMADHTRRVVQKVSKDMLLYCPVATKEDFQSAVAYLIRRLDENTGPDNFLRHLFELKPHSEEWEIQVALFRDACSDTHKISLSPRRVQNREQPPALLALNLPFDNEADTDFSLPSNQKWARDIVNTWCKKIFEPIPLIIGGEEIHQRAPDGKREDPSNPQKTLYTYSRADWALVDRALSAAKNYEKAWASMDVEQRCTLINRAGHEMQKARADLIGVMLVDGAKNTFEADPEVSEAIDFAYYYARSMLKMNACKDIEWSARGTVLVTPPWNFPISIPAGGILAALVSGNCVLFKPAPEAVLSGWILVNALWKAGIPKEALQFINCPDDPVGSRLIADPRLNSVILTGATSTARLFLNMRPSLHLAAETGGKNSLIITAMSDRDLAIKDLVQSAFGHSGQKCSAASLAILEAEVYDDAHFLKQLKDAVESLTVGLPSDLSSKVVPLIRAPGELLLKGLTTLDAGESWLVEPRQDPHHPNLWSPGVKLGVKEGSFMHQTELFGPVLGLMRAQDLDHALRLANGTMYGLTSGIHTLDEREQKLWMGKIEAGNCYINRSITGAIVRRQPFGGCKASSFGPGAKAGGPNYVAQFTHAKQIGMPKDRCILSESVNVLSSFLSGESLSVEELGIWHASLGSYAFWAKRFSQNRDPSKILGQDNLFCYRPLKGVCLRIREADPILDIFRVLAAALSIGSELQVSRSPGKTPLLHLEEMRHALPILHFVEEEPSHFNERVRKEGLKRVRLLSGPSEELQYAAAQSGVHLADAPVLASGRFELLHHLREVAISTDYHRYGNLGVREGELRKPLI